MGRSRPIDREKARQMRRRGSSLRTIEQTLGVARSTASLWVRDIPLTEGQGRLLGRNEAAGRRLGHAVWSERNRESREEAQQLGRAMAGEGFGLHRAGCMLFWAEGSRSRNAVIFTNSDDAMVRYFLRFLRECYGIRDDEVRLSINCFLGNGMSIEEIQRWWLARLALPPTALRKPAINRASSASLRKRPQLPYGTARLAVGSTFIVQSIYGAIQEYAGFERPQWRDLGTRGGTAAEHSFGEPEARRGRDRPTRPRQ